MTLEEYLNKLLELKLAADRAILHQLPSLERVAYDLMVRFIDENLDVTGGKLQADENALRALNNFVDQYLGAFTQSEVYRGNVAQYLKNFKSVGELTLQFQEGRGLNLAKAKLGDVQKLVVGEVVNAYSDNGLNPGFAQPLRDLLVSNVTSGTNLAEAKAQLADFIASGKDTTGKLGQYLQQTAQQGVDSYTGALNTRIMQTFDIGTMIISGSLIKTSSPQCRYCVNQLNGIIDRADWPDVKQIAIQNGLIDGTTFDNLPFNKLHWGCRHEFTPVVLNERERTTLIHQNVNE